MANLITNRLKIIGSNEQIKEVFNFIKVEKINEDQKVYGIGTIDFNKITPMPPWVYTGPLTKEEEEKYGEENCWYKWSIENWGTKWNAYDQLDYRTTEDTLYFTTAWESPVELIRKLSWIFSTVDIEFSWADEDIGNNLGRVRYRNGEIIEEFMPEENTNEAIDFYFKLTKESPDEYDLDEYEFKGINSLAKQYNIDINKEELANFKEFLYNNPLLAYKDEVAQKIFSILKKHFEYDDYLVLNTGEILYRGRIRKIDQPKINEEGLWNPPDGLASHGRYNSIGISVLYCSDCAEAIPYEINPAMNEIIDIATFKVKKKFKLLDMDKLFRGFDGFFNEINNESKILKKSYLLTNYIRDCCIIIGYDGVLYSSVKIDDCNNYALFNFVKNDEIEIVEIKSMLLDVYYSIKEIK